MHRENDVHRNRHTLCFARWHRWDNLADTCSNSMRLSRWDKPADSVVGTTRQTHLYIHATQSLGQPGRLCSSAAPSVDSIILRCEVVSTTANCVGCNIEGRRSLHNVFQLRLFCCSEASSAPSSAAGPTLSTTSLPCHFYPISIICK